MLKFIAHKEKNYAQVSKYTKYAPDLRYQGIKMSYFYNKKIETMAKRMIFFKKNESQHEKPHNEAVNHEKTQISLGIRQKIPTNKEVSCFKSFRCCIYHAYKC